MTSQAVLLLGGRGTRLWPLTDQTPKGLLPVAGYPFVELQLRMLAEAGVGDVRLAVGAQHAEAWDQYIHAQASGSDLRDVRLSLLVEDEPLDTAGAVSAAADSLDDTFFVLNGDVLFEAELAAIDFGETEAAIALTEVPDPSRFGVVVADDDGVVLEFVEKPPPGTQPANTISVGIYRLTPAAFREFAPGPLSFEREVFPALAARRQLSASVVTGRFMDIGTPELYVEGNRYVGAGEFRLLRNGAEMTGDSWVEHSAAVDRSAMLSAAVVLAGASVAAGASVENSVIGWGASVAEGASVSGFSLVGEGASIGRDCRVEGVRVAPGSELTRGSVTVAPPP